MPRASLASIASAPALNPEPPAEPKEPLSKGKEPLHTAAKNIEPPTDDNSATSAGRLTSTSTSTATPPKRLSKKTRNGKSSAPPPAAEARTGTTPLRVNRVTSFRVIPGTPEIAKQMKSMWPEG